MDLIEVCIDNGVNDAVVLCTDKNGGPINLHGATKLSSDRLLVAGSAYLGVYGT